MIGNSICSEDDDGEGQEDVQQQTLSHGGRCSVRLKPMIGCWATSARLIEAAREQTAQVVNSGMVGLYWNIGKRIREDVLQEKRAEYGEAIVSTLSKQLIAEYGRGYSKPNLSRMMRLAEEFPDPADCFDAVETIELEPFRRDPAAQRSPQA